MVEIYEKLGLFYLGQDIDKSTQKVTDALTLLKNKNFTTHAAIIGMTGSGKTGLGIGLIEEAAIDNIPSIVIDPKGDMGNLLLTDPSFSARNFEPWVRDEAIAKDKDPAEYAEVIAAMWKKGIESAHQDSQRVEKFAHVKKTIYTPGSSAGISINILSSLDAPPHEILDDADSFSSYIKTTVSSLLALIGIEADPVESKEYILLAHIISNSWMSANNLSLEDLIGRIISPNFKKIGVLPLEGFYPQAERFKFATKFNAIIASPTFSAWMDGEILDIQKLLYDENGKAKVAIFSISHLNDDERMFFVTLLLNKYIAWMRRQSGTSALKTILYMDEIYGFFPPIKNPPSKEPMMLMLKQARAFGVGIILSTQNPIDLDYKGLSNIGTWFIGRLQTTQDIERVIDGLGGKVGSSYTKKEIKSILSNLKKRTFFLKSAHLDDIRLFSTRWVLSYLKGPLKRDEISRLMEDQKNVLNENNDHHTDKEDSKADGYESYSGLKNTIPQAFQVDLTGEHKYTPYLMAQATLHFFNQTRGIDENEELCLSLKLHADYSNIDWDLCETADEEGAANECFSQLSTQPPANAQYAIVPEIVKNDRNLSKCKKSLKDWLYHKHRLELFRCKKPKLESMPYESEADFKVRLNDLLNEQKEQAIEKLKERYEKKMDTLDDRMMRAEQRLEKEEADTQGSFLSIGMSVMGALFGRTTSGKINRAIRSARQVSKEKADVKHAEERIEKIRDDIEELEEELENKIDELADKYDIENAVIEEFAIKLRRTDIEIDNISVVWKP